MKKNIRKIIVIFIIIMAFLIANKYIDDTIDIYSIREYIKSFGVLSPFVYIIMFTLVPLTFFPDSILVIASGLLFGFSKGYIYTTIGAIFGSSIAFYIARFLGKYISVKKTNKKLESIKKLIDDNGFFIIFLLRLIPLFPFDIISYGAGLTNVKYKDFLLATIIGTIPGIAVFTNIGATSLDIKSNDFYLSIALLISLFVISIVLKNKILKNKLEKSK